MELWGKVVNGKTEIHEKSRVSTDSPWTVEMHIFSLSKAGGFRLLRGGDVILDLKDEKEFNQVGGGKPHISRKACGEWEEWTAGLGEVYAVCGARVVTGAADDGEGRAWRGCWWPRRHGHTLRV